MSYLEPTGFTSSGNDLKRLSETADRYRHLVVHIRKKPFQVKIDRSTRWGNPYSHIPVVNAHYLVANRLEAILQFERQFIATRPDLVQRAQRELKNKVLGCWCDPELCHGHVLARIANEGVGAIVTDKGTRGGGLPSLEQRWAGLSIPERLAVRLGAIGWRVAPEESLSRASRAQVTGVGWSILAYRDGSNVRTRLASHDSMAACARGCVELRTIGDGMTVWIRADGGER